MLLNNGDGTLDTVGLMRIQTGLYQDGSGLKHQTMSTGSVGDNNIVKLTQAFRVIARDRCYRLDPSFSKQV
jgi:hypothetical protein